MYTYEEQVYFIIEAKTQYIFSNSNRLFLELELARGVTQEEFDQEALEFRSLLSRFSRLANASDREFDES